MLKINDGTVIYCVNKSFRLLEVRNAAENAAVLLTSGIDQADFIASADKLKAIWLQKWIALTNYEGIEAWTELRRTNYPPVPKSLAAAPTQLPPVRLYYPGTEAGSNGKNVEAQGSIDVFNTRIFWDVD